MDTKQLLEAAETIRAYRSLFGPPTNEWLPVIAAIGGAFVGGISAFFPNYLIELKKRRDVRTSVKGALLAEVSALVTIVETRRYIEGMKGVAAHLHENPGATSRFRVNIPEHYSRVYQAHIDRIGVLEPALAVKLIQFHQLIDAIVQDIAPGGLVAEEGGTEEAFVQLVEIANQAMTLGLDLAKIGEK